MSPKSFKGRLFLLLSLAVLLFSAATFLFLFPALETLVGAGVRSHLEAASHLLARGWDQERQVFEVPRDGELDLRVTVVAPQGRVLADTHQPPQDMDNHRNRPELRRARHGETALEKRHSITLHRPMTYLAEPLDEEGRILRVAINTSQVDAALERVRRSLLWSLFLAILVGLGIMFLLSRWVSSPLEQLCRQLRDGETLKCESSWPAEIQEMAQLFGQQLDTLQEKRQEAYRIARKHRDFVANASHELRTPVTALSGLLEALEMGAKDETERRDHFLGLAAEQVSRMQQLTHGLLDLATAEQGYQPSQSVAVSEILHQVEVEMTGLAESSSQNLRIESGGVEAQLDREVTVRLLRILLENALKYSPPGQTIEVRASLEDQQVLLEVLDRGPGIPEKSLERVFERFYRVERDRNRKSGGAGLGLAIARHLTAGCGGSVGVENREGGGLRAFVRLPQFLTLS